MLGAGDTVVNYDSNTVFLSSMINYIDGVTTAVSPGHPRVLWECAVIGLGLGEWSGEFKAALTR